MYFGVGSYGRFSSDFLIKCLDGQIHRINLRSAVLNFLEKPKHLQRIENLPQKQDSN
jgi:hypothetical protein